MSLYMSCYYNSNNNHISLAKLLFFSQLSKKKKIVFTRNLFNNFVRRLMLENVLTFFNMKIEIYISIQFIKN